MENILSPDSARVRERSKELKPRIFPRLKAGGDGFTFKILPQSHSFQGSFPINPESNFRLSRKEQIFSHLIVKIEPKRKFDVAVRINELLEL